MKSNVPWSVKGIEPEARATAKKAAKRAGMTLGEWMNTMIKNAEDNAGGTDGSISNAAPNATDLHKEYAPPSSQTGANTPVTVGQLYELVQSLNRMNERLKTSETHSRAAVAGLSEALPSVLERLRKVETQKHPPQPDNALTERLVALEEQSHSREEIDSLKSLEKALRQVVHQFENAQNQTLQRVAASEQTIVSLSEKYKQVDNKITQAFMDLRKSVGEVNDRIAKTEEYAATILAEAQSTSASQDTEAMAQTSLKLRSLGNEIKRTSDQIVQLESNIKTLSGKIEASEERSSKGILGISSTIKALQEDLLAHDGLLKPAHDPTQKPEESPPSLTNSSPSNKKTPSSSPQTPSSQTLSPPSNIRVEIENQIADFRENEEPEAQNERSTLTNFEAPISADVPTHLDVQLDPEQTTDVQLPSRVETPSDTVESRKPLSPREKVLLAAQARRKRLSKPSLNESPSTDTPPPPPFQQDPLHLGEFDDTLINDAETSSQPVIREQIATPPPLDDKDAARFSSAPKDRDTPENQAFEAPAAPASPAAAQGGDDLRAIRDAISREQLKQEQLREERAVERRKQKRAPSRFPLILGGGAVLILLIGGGIFFWLGTNKVNDHTPVKSTDSGISSFDQPIQEPSTGSSDALIPTGPQDTDLDGSQLYAKAKTAVAAARSEEEKSIAFDLMRRAAVVGGYPPAQYELGELHREGIGVIASIQTAKTWYTAAAEAGNVKAMHRLGTVTANAEDATADSQTAISWLEQAASFGYVNSIYNLGFLYNPNNDMLARDQRDAGKSIYWFSLAASLGDVEAAEKVNEITSMVTPEKLAEIDARVAEFQPKVLLPSANDLTE